MIWLLPTPSLSLNTGPGPSKVPASSHVIGPVLWFLQCAMCFPTSPHGCLLPTVQVLVGTSPPQGYLPRLWGSGSLSTTGYFMVLTSQHIFFYGGGRGRRDICCSHFPKTKLAPQRQECSLLLSWAVSSPRLRQRWRGPGLCTAGQNRELNVQCSFLGTSDTFKDFSSMVLNLLFGHRPIWESDRNSGLWSTFCTQFQGPDSLTPWSLSINPRLRGSCCSVLWYWLSFMV